MESNVTNPDSNLDSPTQAGINSFHDFKVLLTNARSLSPKINSLHTFFREHELDFSLITESWLKDSALLDRDVIDLEWGTNLKIIYKNRPRGRTGLRKVGGGVSIVFDKSKCSLKERKIEGNKFELVLAVSKVGKIARQVAIFCVYLEPRMKVAEVAELCELLAEEILRLKAKGDPLIMVGGDINRKDISEAFKDFPDIKRSNHAPTRGDACLDVMFSNSRHINDSTWPPLETDSGIQSDHKCVLFDCREEIVKNFKWIRREARKHTDAALEEYGRELAMADWGSILGQNLSAAEMIEKFQAWNDAVTERLFPVVSFRCRDNEPPWITNGIRKLAKHKMRVYKREGKSNLWRRLQAQVDALVEGSMADFVTGIEQAGPNTRKYFQAVKQLGSAAATVPSWELTDLFPGCTGEEAGERAAGYFTRITDTFEPLRDDDDFPVAPARQPLSLEDVAKRLSAAKKPCSQVKGDLLPRVMKKHHQLVVAPVTLIFNAVLREGKWPDAWKEETTVVIPKVANPETLADCCNISCTPFLSKVLEGVLLDDLRGVIDPDPVQYGGIKGCSVDHLLVDLFDAVLEPMEAGASSVVLGIDYEKAFNGLDHRECLRQLRRLGATQTMLNLTRSFLTNRLMRVKIGKLLSSPHVLKGGSPQGSILGCFLYCITTQQLNLNLVNTNAEDPMDHSLAEPLATNNRGSQGDEGDSEGFDLMPGDVEVGSNSSDDSFRTAVTSIESVADLDLGCDWDLDREALITLFKYVDDTTSVETVPAGLCIRHISAARPTEQIPTRITGQLIEAICRRANDVGMRVNYRKTQMLCLSPDNGYESWASIAVGEDTIKSQSTMKLLGFVLGTAPGVGDHVDHVKAKFRARFWTLIHLRRAGIRGDRLFRLYATLIRPVLEVNSVVFHSMLTKTQAESIEILQKQVCRLCYGWEYSYRRVLQAHNIQTLHERREMAIKRFVAKTIRGNPRFANRWFIRRQEVDAELRNRRPYVEKRARTDRFKKSPLVYMQKIANDLETE